MEQPRQKRSKTVVDDADDALDELVDTYAAVKAEDRNLLFLGDEDSKPERELNVDEIFASAANKYHQRVKAPGIPLKPYQEEGLAWMLTREAFIPKETLTIYRSDWDRQDDGWINRVTGIATTQEPVLGQLKPRYEVKQDFHGGILADEMGLGKTLQIIALVVAHPKPTNSPTKNTLIVVPAIMLGTWKKELERWAPQLTFYVHHGSGRTKNRGSDRLKRDVVLTTYGIMYRDVFHGEKVLEATQWWRIVLDEAHIIRNAESKVARSAHSLNAVNRWAVTGTPIQNKWTDMFSLLKFLHIRPYGEWQGWRRFIDAPLTQKSSQGWAREQATQNLRNLVQAIVLRRTKKSQTDSNPLFTEGLVVRLRDQPGFWEVVERRNSTYVVREKTPKPRPMSFPLPYVDDYGQTTYTFIRELIHLPEKQFNTVELDWLYDYEAKTYAALMSKAEIFKTEWKGMTKTKKAEAVDNVLVWLLKLRQATIHPWLVTMRDFEDQMKRVKANPESWRSSTKIDYLIQDVRETKQGGARSDEKSLVFSQFTTALDLIEYALRRDGWISQNDRAGAGGDKPRFVRIQGSTLYEARERAIEALQKNPAVKLALLSLYATGVGLTLTAANNVYFMDLAFNPQVMAQAIDRTHRIGQERDVIVKQLVVNGTVEEKMLLLLQRKREIADVALDPPRLTIDQIINLL